MSVQLQLVSFVQKQRGIQWNNGGCIGYAHHRIAWKSVFLLHVHNKNENITNARYFYFLKIAKIHSEEEKPICPNHKNFFPQNTNIADPQK